MIGYAIDVHTRELTEALKRLRKTDKNAPLVSLRYVPGKLTISRGQASEELPATGTRPSLVSASARWITALATNPFPAAITDLQVHDGNCGRGHLPWIAQFMKAKRLQ